MKSAKELKEGEKMKYLALMSVYDKGGILNENPLVCIEKKSRDISFLKSMICGFLELYTDAVEDSKFIEVHLSRES